MSIYDNLESYLHKNDDYLLFLAKSINPDILSILSAGYNKINLENAKYSPKNI